MQRKHSACWASRSRSPRFDNDAITRVRAQIVAALQQEDEDPQNVASKGFMNAFIGDHPYAHPINGTIASISRINRNDVRAFAREHWVREWTENI